MHALVQFVHVAKYVVYNRVHVTGAMYLQLPVHLVQAPDAMYWHTPLHVVSVARHVVTVMTTGVVRGLVPSVHRARAVRATAVGLAIGFSPAVRGLAIGFSQP
jgi:hypothetical protein